MRRLLVVDDNTDLLSAMESLVSLYNFTVQTATNHKTLLEKIESFKPDIVLIDVLLAGENGKDICRALRENPANKEMTLILFSASPKDLLDFKECRADGVIEKPFGIKELIQQIETAVQSRKEHLTN